MEQRDLELIQKHRHEDKLLDKLYQEHITYEQQLERFNDKSYLTPREEVERKTLQKKKLLGRDRIEAILAKYRKVETAS